MSFSGCREFFIRRYFTEQDIGGFISERICTLGRKRFGCISIDIEIYEPPNSCRY